jgi:hypothetical protein
MTTLMGSLLVLYPSIPGKHHRAQHTVTRNCIRHRLSLAGVAVVIKYLVRHMRRMKPLSDHMEDRTNLDAVRREASAEKWPRERDAGM